MQMGVHCGFGWVFEDTAGKANNHVDIDTHIVFM